MTPAAEPSPVAIPTLVRIEGPDALAFLNGQFTCDVAALVPGAWTWGGYCSPKGRLLVTFRLGLLDGTYLLQCPAGQGAELAARLRRYVLRAKVSLTPVPASYRTGPAGALGIPEPPAIGHLRADGTRIVWGLQPGIIALDAPEAEPAAPDWTGDLALGAPWILPANAEAFVPQMADLDRAGGVSFTKGCYPGQEVVARARYLGEVKRHLFRITWTGSPAPAAGEPVLSGDRAVGAVLYGAGSDDRGAALAVLDTASALAGGLSANGRPIGTVERVHPDA